MATAVESPPVNRADDALTPTASHFSLTPRQPDHTPASDPSPSKTPTRSSFSAHSSEKRPLSGDAPSAGANSNANPTAATAHAGANHGVDDVKMEDNEDDQDGSDNDNEDEEGGPAKKKRSQRFFCTQFPPCNLSFTRSEHLARHIRKHTGERPFQCHCLRRFSRLDNLRQHAQTVHVNEDIPGDSLAATGTRYQRQVRTERIRPAGHRQRASTLSAGGHSRGHSRNMSNSSIGSVSDFGSPEDPRRRPASMVLPPSTPPRHSLSIETFPGQQAPLPYYNYPPSGYSTPAYSAADPGSPRMSSGLGSPIAMMPRSAAIGWGGQNSSRRLSIPSAPPPYHQAPPAFAVPPSAPFVHQQPHAPVAPYAPQPIPASRGNPAPSHLGHSRHQSLESTEDWRRRTWHASTRSNVETRPATSSLTYHQRPDDPQPVSSIQPAAQQAVRLPGIDSFDRPQVQAGVRSRRLTNDTEMDEASQAGDDTASKRDSWGSMHQNLHSLELAQNTPPRDKSHWRHSTGSHAALAAAAAAARPLTAPHSGVPVGRPETVRDTAERPSTPKRQKRSSDWSYEAALADGDGGPGPAVRTSPEGSSNSDELPTPMNHPGAEYRPAIVHDNGYVEGEPVGVLDDTSKAQEVHRTEAASYAPMPPTFSSPSKHNPDTGRLDALVAVATSEERAMSRH